MIVTTTGSVEGRRIAQYLGIVSGDAVMGTDFVRDLFAAVRDVVGGRVASYEKEMHRARESALNALVEDAQSIGADAVVGLTIDCESIGGSQKTLLMVCASGTAVKLED